MTMREKLRAILLTEEAIAASIAVAIALVVAGWAGFELHTRGFEAGTETCEAKYVGR